MRSVCSVSTSLGCWGQEGPRITLGEQGWKLDILYFSGVFSYFPWAGSCPRGWEGHVATSPRWRRGPSAPLPPLQCRAARARGRPQPSSAFSAVLCLVRFIHSFIIIAMVKLILMNYKLISAWWKLLVCTEAPFPAPTWGCFLCAQLRAGLSPARCGDCLLMVQN